MTECASPREVFTARARVNGKDCQICHERTWFGWNRVSRGQSGHYEDVAELVDVLAVLPTRRGGCLDIANRTCPSGHTEITLYHGRKKPKHQRTLQTIVVEFSDPQECIQWSLRLQSSVAEVRGRPRNVHVFINPVGGRKRAPAIYQNQVAPLLHIADVNATVTVTERANHALEALQEMQLTGVDGLICVGGDGMFHEVLNGLLLRAQRDAGVNVDRARFLPVRPRITIGIIPAGSTDAVVFGTTGTVDPITSTIQIILGESQAMDIASIESSGCLLRFASLACSYGFLGDTLEHSETMRWMGPRRYDIAGTRCFLKNKGYGCKIRYLPSQDEESHPLDKSSCFTNCPVCNKSTDETGTNREFEKGASALATNEEVADATDSSIWQSLEGRFSSVVACLSACASPRSKAGLSPSAHFGDGCLDLLIVRHGSRLNTLRQLVRVARQGSPLTLPFVEVRRCKEIQFRPILPPDLEDGLRTRSEASSVLQLSRSSSDNRLAANGRSGHSLSTGGNTVADASSTTGLTETNNGTPRTPEPPSPSEVVSSAERAARLRDHVSIWNVDGEIVSQAGIDVRVHRQLITLYCSGISAPVDTDRTGCFGGANSRSSPSRP
ncbi:ceramide kinase-like [Sycon ciliatum]|uniref:ceramide kinase-like n=1 Tax=Sycon ciliatum TaxID=27933 RepID=UPI0020AC44FA|eukprot:scpid49336/ scgid19133/ Ceramide kinase; Acylsphingosine kinase; Lipid kinase 4